LTSLDHTIREGNSVISDPAVQPKAFDWQATLPTEFASASERGAEPAAKRRKRRKNREEHGDETGRHPALAWPAQRILLDLELGAPKLISRPCSTPEERR
jgi:hypothetical protein